MPPSLHPHLKRGLDFDEFHVKPEDVIEEPPVERLGPEERAAKRQRIEKIAAQCLQGRRPVILSAGLRGPFNDGWKNPWAKGKAATRRSSDKHNSARDKRHVAKRTSAGTVGSSGVKKRTKTEARKTREEHPVASPEASRAAGKELEAEERNYTLEEIDVPPATAPLSEEPAASGATEFFSVDTEQIVRNRSALTNPFWLRRAEATRGASREQSASEYTEPSPTRSRSTLQHPVPSGTLRIAKPKAPLDVRASPSRKEQPYCTSSAASASMIISSPVKPAGPASHGTNRPSTTELAGPILPSPKPPSKSPQAQAAQLRHEEVVQTVLATSAYKASPIKSSSLSNDDAQRFACRENASLSTSPVRSSRGDIQRSVERLAGVIPAPSLSRNKLQKPIGGPVHAKTRLRQPQDEFVTSPAPNTASGFTYKKVRGTKWTIDNAPRSKPRAGKINSSPALKTNSFNESQARPHSTNNDAVVRPSDQSDETIFNSNPADAEGTPGLTGMADGSCNDSLHDSQSLKSTRSSRESAYSTQAAMLLAQLEFQESTFPISSGPSRPWSQPQDNTPRQILPDLSPAITPYSLYRPQLGQSQVANKEHLGPPISTQDLFAAASPFAFSTIKKKAEPSQHSNLRVSTLPFDRHDASREVSNLSDNRILSQEKNAALSGWSFAFEKGSQTPQPSVKSPTTQSASDFNTLQLDSTTSLEEYGPDGSLNIADRFLSLEAT